MEEKIAIPQTREVDSPEKIQSTPLKIPSARTVCVITIVWMLAFAIYLAGACPSSSLVTRRMITPSWSHANTDVKLIRPEVRLLTQSAKNVAQYIEEGYRIEHGFAKQVTEWAIEIGEAKNLDPLLILAVVATESSFKPKARSGADAEGLMQVMTQVHLDKFQAFGGSGAALEPYPNLVVGSEILRGLIARTGSVRMALKWYSGAANLRTDFGYGAKVIREYSRLSLARKAPDDALQLLRKKKSASTYKNDLKKKKLPFVRWEQ